MCNNIQPYAFLRQIIIRDIFLLRVVTASLVLPRLMGMNVYITNTSLEEIPTNYVHSLYSLRWQIEILFKTWKSFFEIDECKNIKKERLECHLYGQLIGILLCSSTMFQMRQLLLERKKQELSEETVIYKNCSEVRAAGAAPISKGEPGYSSKLDRDGDGIACDQ